MVFGFFSRKPAPPPESAEAGPSAVTAPSSAAYAGPSVSPEFRFPPVKQQHTPAPSIDSATTLTNADTDAQYAPKPKKPRAKPKPKALVKETSPLVSEIPPGPTDTPSPGPEDALVTDPNALYSLISSVPAQTLHFYTLAHLSPSPPSALPLGITAPAPIVPPSPETLTALTTFFAHLAPPPKLHCVRCHRGYFELENGDNACRVPHDDESAIVQRVGTSQNARALHETLWGCCGRTVDGDGDQGPPDGWCYEGAHTIDVKRARFRADSTMQDDMLTSCEKMRCGMPPRSVTSRTSRKRNRRAVEAEEEEEDDDEESVVSSGRTHSRTHSRSISISSAKGKGKMGPPAGVEGKDDEARARPVKRARARKTSISASKKESEEDKEDAMEVDDNNEISPPSPPKSPKRTRTTSTTSPNNKLRRPSAPPSPKPKPKPKASAKPTSKSSTGTAPVQRSPLSASFVPASASSSTVHVRPESPIRKPRGRVEVEIISRTPPKGDVLSKKASVGSLRSQTSVSSLRASTRTTRPLREVVDTSVDGEGWS